MEEGMNGPLTRASLHLERAKGLVVELVDLAAMESLLPTLATALRTVRQELERAERNLRDAGTWAGDAGAGDRLRGIASRSRAARTVAKCRLDSVMPSGPPAARDGGPLRGTARQSAATNARRRADFWSAERFVQK
jgi:hypothetical protein